MSIDQYYIMVDKQEAPDIGRLLSKLGLADYRESGKVVGLWDTYGPRTLYIAHYNNTLIFADMDLAFEFFRDAAGDVEKRFVACFPDCRIAALIQNESASMFGFCIIANGKRIRLKDSWEESHLQGFGEPLPEEEAEYQDFKERMDPDERQDIIEEAGEEGLDEYLRHTAAWGMPNVISKSFLGEYMGAIDGTKVVFREFMNHQKE